MTRIASLLPSTTEIGCALTVTETGVAVAGEPNHSHNNMRRLGFRSVGLRYNYAPEGTTWLRQAS